jgi:hypothetical protein
MTDFNLDLLFEKFNESLIENIIFDIFKHSLTINIKVFENQKHKLLFEGVSAFFFANDIKNRRFNITDWENAELSEIHYITTMDDLITYKNEIEGFPEYEASANFFIEIWNSIFLIEAKVINIDDEKYIVR